MSKYFQRLALWSSSQRVSGIKQGPNSDGIDPRNEKSVKVEQDQETEAGEAQVHEARDGTLEEDDGEMNSSPPNTGEGRKKKKKKSGNKKKRKSRDAVEEQLGADGGEVEQAVKDEPLTEAAIAEDTVMEDPVSEAPVEEPAASVSGERVEEGPVEGPVAPTGTANESTEPEHPVADERDPTAEEKEPTTEVLSKPKRTRKANGTTLKRKRTPRSKATIESGDEEYEERRNGNKSMLQLVVNQLRQPGKGTRLLEAMDEEENDDASSQLQRDALATTSPEPGNDEDAENEEPRRPSKKALGKRKAVDEPSRRGPNKKPKRGSEKGSGGQDLRTFGFTERRNSTAPSDPASLRSEVEKVTAKLYRESHSGSHSNSTVKKPRLSQSGWNAINRSVESDAGQGESNAEVLVPASRGEEEQDISDPSRAAAKSTSRSHSPQPNDPDVEEESDGDLFLPPGVQPESELDSPGPSTAPPKSNRRKRRLPVEDFDPSQSLPTTEPQSTPAKRKAKTPAKTTKTPKTPKTPRLKKEKVKTPRAVSTKGKLSAGELESIYSAVTSWQEMHNLSDYQLNELVQSDAQKAVAQELWKEVCEEVPDIPRRSVQNASRRKFHNYGEARGAWTDELDEELRRAYEEHPKKWKLIGEIMHRFPEDVRDRWRNYLVCGDSLKKDTWDLEEEGRLRAAVRACIRDRQKANRRGGGSLVDPETLIDWQEVSGRMDHTRSRLQCRNKWTKLKDRGEYHVDDPASILPIGSGWRLEHAAHAARLFSAGEKLALLRSIRDSKTAREGKIPWSTLQKELNGNGKRMAWKYCFRKLKEHVPGHAEMEFQDIIAHLVEIFEIASPDEPDGFDLPIPVVKPDKETGKQPDVKKNPSTPKAQQGRKRKRNKDADGAIEGASTVERRRVRDRMLKDGESQETAPSHEDVCADVGEDVVQSFQSLKRSPAAKGKRAVRRSKRNSALSEEKIVDSSDEEEVVVNGESTEPVDEEPLVNGHAAEDDLPPDVLDNVHTLEVDEEETGSISFLRKTNGDEMEDDEARPSTPGGELSAADDESDAESSEAFEDEVFTTGDEPEANEDSGAETNVESSEENQKEYDSKMDIDEEETYTTPGGPAADDESDEGAGDASPLHPTNTRAHDQRPSRGRGSMRAKRGGGLSRHLRGITKKPQAKALHTSRAESLTTSTDLAEGLEEDLDEFELGLTGRANDYHPEGSPDLDTPVRSRSFKRLGSPFLYPNGFHEPNIGDGSVSSDDNDMSDIPATRLAREESVEL